MKDIKRIELNDNHVKLRIIILIALIPIAIAGFSIFFINLFSKKSGFEEINVSSSTADPVSDDELTFYYNLGKSGNSPTDDFKKVTESYSRHLDYAYKSLNKYKEVDEYKNLYYLNRHPNETMKVSTLLYDSLKKVYDTDPKILYLGPITTLYENYIKNGNDGSNPTNPSVKQYIDSIVNYIKSDISIDFLNDYNIKLNVSDNYLNILDELSVNDILDFSYLRNAFILDYVSTQLISDGFKYGNIQSYDGYYINLDDTYNYKYDVYDIIDRKLISTCYVDFMGKYNIVNYRNFAINNMDYSRFRIVDDKLTSLYINPNDGKNYESIKNLTSYSKTKSLVDIVLETKDIYINNNFNENNISIESIWLKDRSINYNDKNLTLNNIYSKNDVSYKVNSKEL